jgi:SAM-dependent methyltransferase
MLYAELSSWWPVFSPPEVYAERAALFAEILKKACNPKLVLELGCGGGSMAWHLKKHFEMHLADISPQMLRVAAQLNPDCERFQADMREARLNRTYDAVFLNDAVMYMKTEEDLRKTMATAYAHVRPGGAALFVPDATEETFLERTEQGGGELDGREGRYMAWFRDPDPTDGVYEVDFAILLCERDGQVRCLHDHHECGVFPRGSWLRWLKEAGFQAEKIAYHSEMFLGRRG